MRKIILITLVLNLALVKIYGQEHSQIIVPNFNDKYSMYVQMLQNGEINIDYQDFRYSFIDSEQFLIASEKAKNLLDLTKQMYAEIDKLNYGEIILIAKQMLSIDYTNMRAHKALRQTYDILGDTLNAQKHRAIGFGLLHSIVDRGDGKTCKTAWPVIQVSEEYFILDMIGAGVKQQSIYNKDGICDEMYVIVDGENRTYYFEISKVFEGHGKKR